MGESCDEEADRYMDTILVDYSLLTSDSDSNSNSNSNSSYQQSTAQLDNFKSALSSSGCLQLINHGIAPSFLNELREASKRFVALPTEEKQKYAIVEGGFNGYDRKNLADSENQDILDWNEGLSLTVYPQDRIQPEFWPHNPPNLRTLLQEYTAKITPILEELLKALIRSLKVDLEKFEKQYGKNKEINMRINYYPICPTSRHGLGLQPHADFSTMTLILQDEEGLEVCKDGQWFKVPVIPDALFLLLGDPTEIMSNGIFKSAVHRAVTNTDKSRVSIAMFYDSDRNCDVGPLDDLITSSRPQQYQTVSLQNYTSKFFDYYPSGQRLIEAIKIHNS